MQIHKMMETQPQAVSCQQKERCLRQKQLHPSAPMYSNNSNHNKSPERLPARTASKCAIAQTI